MRSHGPRKQTRRARLLISILVLNSTLGICPAVAQAQNRVIVVTADQPNVWTLEQAHYLLAQMHRRDLDLRAKSLDALDPNEINGLRFDVLRTLTELGVAFNDANRVANGLLARNQKFNEERRQTLIARRDQRRQESLALTRDIGQLQAQKAQATTQAEKDTLDAQIAAKTAVRTEVDKDFDLTDKELQTLTAPSGDFKTTDAPVSFDASKLPKTAFDDAFKDAAKKLIEQFNQSPHLNASLMLDNFLQMQYEIISKQLTLLRDEVGPGERLLFLELPQSVNVTYHEANNKWAQSWWRIAGYTRREKGGAATPEQMTARLEETTVPKGARNQRPVTTVQDYNSILKGTDIIVPTEDGEKKGTTKTREALAGVKYFNKFISLDDQASISGLSADAPRPTNQLVRTVELIPRQSSLNVNDMKLRAHAGALTAVASFLFGLGARVNIQRQREQFSQFVQQELYSSAFGKGSRAFGWTFTPMPGTDRLLAGTRTTYAAVVVPDVATTLVLESNGCYFPRSAYQPNNFADTMSDRWNVYNRTSRNCGDAKTFVVSIPSAGLNGNNDFFVSGLTYAPVDKGERIVVAIYGENFSAQTGVLVNGVPLLQAIGLAQPLIRDDSKAGEETAKDFKDEKIRGSIERVDANEIVISFKMPDDFEDATPTITLVAPGKALSLNGLNDLYINGQKPATLSPDDPEACEDKNPKPGCVPVAAKMFNGPPPPKAFRLDSVDVFRNTSRRTLTALITGAGFDSKPQVFVNGKMPAKTLFVSKSLIQAEFDTPTDADIQVTIADPGSGKTIKSKPVVNPSALRVDNVTVVSYEAGSKDVSATLVVKLEGVGFTDALIPSVGELVVKSATEAFLKLENPPPAVVVTLTDRRTGFETKTIISRKSPPPQ